MAKAHIQIAFDFFAPQEEEKQPVIPAPVKEDTAPATAQVELKPLLQKPTIIEIDQPEPEIIQVTEEKIVDVEPEAFVVVKDEVLEVEALVEVAEREEESNNIIIVESKAKKNGETRGRRSLKEKALDVHLIEIPNDEVLFQRQYYPIGEVAEMFHENQSLIRYWETEFDILKPRKNGKGDRLFRPIDVKNIALIYDLLRRRKFTIQGAKDYLKNNKKAEEKFALVQSLQQMKSFFQEIKANL